MPRSGRKAIHSTSTVTISGFLNDFMLHEASYSAHNSCFLNVANYYCSFSEVWDSKKSAVTSANAILTYLLKQFPLYHKDLEMLAEFSLFSNDFSSTILTHAFKAKIIGALQPNSNLNKYIASLRYPENMWKSFYYEATQGAFGRTYASKQSRVSPRNLQRYCLEDIRLGVRLYKSKSIPNLRGTVRWYRVSGFRFSSGAGIVPWGTDTVVPTTCPKASGAPWRKLALGAIG